jgi:outer membrane protein, multidrug efflux system
VKLMTSLMGAAIALALSGCASMAPHYERPAAPVADTYPGAKAGQAANTNAVPAAELSWRALFADDKLKQVVQRSLDNNRDLRIAALRVEQAQAQHRIQRSALFPSIGATAAEVAQRSPDSLTMPGQPNVMKAYSASVGVNAYELDLFGRVRSLNEEALQAYLATGEAQRTVHMGLVAQVATTYMALAADGALESLAKQTLESREHAYDIQKQRQDVGASSALELRQAEAEREDARAQWLDASKQLELDRNALDLLVGGKVPDELLPAPGALGGMLAVDTLPAGLPSSLLQDRPDILAAEHQLRGANANIGAARAAFFPSISLTASAGTASNELSGLFEGGGSTWSFMPVINIPIFNGGRLEAQLDVSKVRKDIAVAEYERTIQVAFREVADELATQRVVADQEGARRKQADAAEAARRMVTSRYDEGVVGYLEVLDAQRTAYTAQQTVIAAELARQVNVVGLYKALGGGWDGGDKTPGVAVAEVK